MPSTSTYEGGCHCGTVRFRVTADLATATECNCSICTKKGFIHLIVPPADFEVTDGHDALATYQFNTPKRLHGEAPSMKGDDRAWTDYATITSRIYFGEDGFVERTPYAPGSAAGVIARGQMAPTSIAVDATRVYWSTSDCAINSTAQ